MSEEPGTYATDGVWDTPVFETHRQIRSVATKHLPQATLTLRGDLERVRTCLRVLNEAGLLDGLGDTFMSCRPEDTDDE